MGWGDKQFLRHTFEKAVEKGQNFFNDYPEPLFYNALANGERDENFFDLLNCKIPFLNGGLFETIGGYDWVNTDIVFDNKIFSNSEKTKNGDIGTGILDVFDRYNFTVKEDEPLEKEVAVDPEMLGKVFEELLEVNDRKSKGAFYTPREIVHYMCQESLINYLSTELGATDDCHSELVSEFPLPVVNSSSLTKQAIADFIHHSDKLAQNEHVATEKENQNTKYQHLLAESIKNHAEDIDKALENIKICDPAIGSGAFPVGMMNEIVRARIALVESGYLRSAKKPTTYEYKRQAIQNSIYGVDIESGAVEIAKLRLWLSLVVDEDNIENIKALPNLDYKIVCANSLEDLYNVIIPDNLQTRFTELSNLHFDETRKSKKREYKKEIDAIKLEIFRIAKSLNCDAQFDYRLFFHDVFSSGGFNIIIANPPYVGEKGHKEIFEPIKKYSLKEFYLGKMDYFYFFFHLALNLLKEGGCCTFITTNYYITALGARYLRRDFKNRAILIELINFNELKIFESALGQHNLITILTKGQNPNALCKLINVNRKGFIDQDFENIVFGKDKNTNYNSIPQTVLYDGAENYIRVSKEDENSELSVILNKIKGNNDVLGNISNVNAGIMGGCDFVTAKNITYTTQENINEYDICINDGVFVLYENNSRDISTVKNLQASKILKDFYKNSDISKYSTLESSSKKILFSAPTCTNEEKDIIKKGLLKFKQILTKIRAINHENLENWYLLRRGTGHPQIFICPKIVAPQRSKTNTFGYNECEWYAASDVFFITEPEIGYQLKYILALLNSHLYYIWLYNRGKRKGETLELIAKPLSEIPIKKADTDTQSKFVSIVDKILAITQSDDYLENSEKQQAVKEYEKQIDLMTYKLYALTYEEVQTIDKTFTLAQGEYDNYEL